MPAVHILYWREHGQADHLIRSTPNGVVIDLKRLFVYPDGHAHLTFADRRTGP
jgi:hypothetical protein